MANGKGFGTGDGYMIPVCPLAWGQGPEQEAPKFRKVLESKEAGRSKLSNKEQMGPNMRAPPVWNKDHNDQCSIRRKR